MAAPPLHAYVRLPWAPAVWPLETALSRGDGSAAADAVTLRPAALGHAEPHAAQYHDTARPERSIDARLSALRLPYSPEPSVPDEDRPDKNVDATIQGAVALDVLCTWTRALSATPTVLAELTALLVRLVSLGKEADEDPTAELLALASSETARRRALLTADLAAKLATACGDDQGGATSPASVAAAVRRIERLATLVVRDAELLLDTHETVDYQQV